MDIEDKTTNIVYRKFMSLAIEEAKIAKSEGNLPFGAVIVKNMEVISTAHSMEATKHDITRHAELIAISKACRNLGDMMLTNTTIYASGEPCNMCSSAIFHAHIPKIVIGSMRNDIDGFFRKRKIGIQKLADDSNYPINIITGIMKNESIKLFDDIKIIKHI